MPDFNRTFPPLLSKLHELAFDYADGDGIDFEPYEEFLSAEETARWLRAWTGNHDVDGNEFRVFGQDGSGGYAALWLVGPTDDLTAQPVVFLSSEGERGVVARDLADYLWLLADGVGPCEAVLFGDAPRVFEHGFAEFANTHASAAKKSASAVIAAAKAGFPEFEGFVACLVR